MLQRILVADAAGHQVHKAYEYSHIALAGATPIAALSGKGSLLQRTSDMVMAFAIPVHMHVAMNACVSDYMPSAVRVPVRYGLIGASALTFLGLLKLNLVGAGITGTVCGLWDRPAKK